jgi:hypothetical protein
MPKHRSSRSDELLVVYHGTDYPFEFVRAGCWVSLAEAEAAEYAESMLLLHVADDPGARWFYVNGPWVLELRVRRSAVEWLDGYGDDDFDGLHGRLLKNTPVVRALKLSGE